MESYAPNAEFAKVIDLLKNLPEVEKMTFTEGKTVKKEDSCCFSSGGNLQSTSGGSADPELPDTVTGSSCPSSVVGHSSSSSDMGRSLTLPKRLASTAYHCLTSPEDPVRKSESLEQVQEHQDIKLNNGENISSISKSVGFMQQNRTPILYRSLNTTKQSTKL